jgi:hypothetical protein
MMSSRLDFLLDQHGNPGHEGGNQNAAAKGIEHRRISPGGAAAFEPLHR